MPEPARGPARHRHRLAWLLACSAAGALVGMAGSAVTGSELWYLAIPAAVAAGWLFFADPSSCTGNRKRSLQERLQPRWSGRRQTRITP